MRRSLSCGRNNTSVTQEDVYLEIYPPSLPHYLANITQKASGTDINMLLIVTVEGVPGMMFGLCEIYGEHETYLPTQFSCLSGMSGVTFCVEVHNR